MAKLKPDPLADTLADLVSVINDYLHHGDDYLGELKEALEKAEKILNKINDGKNKKRK